MSFVKYVYERLFQKYSLWWFAWVVTATLSFDFGFWIGNYSGAFMGLLFSPATVGILYFFNLMVTDTINKVREDYFQWKKEKQK